MARGKMTGGWYCKSCNVVKTYRRDKTCVQCRPSTRRGFNLRKISLVRVRGKTSAGKLQKAGLGWQITLPKPVKTEVKLEETDEASQSSETSTRCSSPSSPASSSNEAEHPLSQEGHMSEPVRRELLDAVRREWNNLIDCMEEMQAHSVMAQCFALATAYNGPSPMPEGMPVSPECVTALLVYGIAVCSCITDPEDYEEVLLKIKQLQPKAVVRWKCFWINAMNHVDGPVLAH